MHDPRDEEELLTPGSERAFGLVFAAVFVAIALWPVLWGGAPLVIPLGIATVFAAAAMLAPEILRPLNRLWFRFGLLLHRIVSPLVMAAVFFLCVTPIALLMRACGKDVLSLRRRADLTTYWIAREPAGPEPASLKNQF